MAADMLLRCERAAARLGALERREREVDLSVGAARRFLEHAPAIQAVLDESQRRINQEIVGGLSTMLSHLLQGVMDDPDRSIVCESEIDGRGNSTVRFHVQRRGGETEDILSGNGGSVANVICTGLRLIAVHRAKRMRRLLVLDEPDCWLSPERMPVFLGLLQRAVMSMPEPMQVLLVTHHDVSDSSEPINTVDLVRVAGALRIKTHIAHPAVEGQVSALELQNWRSHAHSHIPLGSGLTVLRGANNLGKSAIVEALRCIAYGGARADVVAHGQTEARATLHLVGQSRIELARKRRGSPATIYRHLQDDQVLHEDAGGKGVVPPWMGEVLGIAEVDGQQIHIADQKQPIFLLDQPASRQTAILSVGQEAQSIVAMLDRFKEAKRQAMQTVREGEALLERYRRMRLQAGDASISSAADWEARSIALRAASEDAQAAAKRLVGLDSLMQPLRRLARVTPFSLPVRPVVPPAQDAMGAAKLSNSIARLRAVAGLRLPVLSRIEPLRDSATVRDRSSALMRLTALRTLSAPAPLQPPQAIDDGAAKLSAAIAKLRAVVVLSKHIALPQATDLLPFDASKQAALIGLRDSVERIKEITEQGAQERQVLANEKAKYATQTQSIVEFERELGACPLCGGAFGAQHGHGHERSHAHAS